MTHILCLAAVAFLEARGEGLDGMAAVADTVITRMAHRDQSACEVAQSGQYAWAEVNLEYLGPEDRIAFDMAKQIATAAIYGHSHMGIEADFFHEVSVTPYWADDMALVGRIGNHVYYDSKGE